MFLPWHSRIAARNASVRRIKKGLYEATLKMPAKKIKIDLVLFSAPLIHDRWGRPIHCQVGFVDDENKTVQVRLLSWGGGKMIDISFHDDNFIVGEVIYRVIN
jgi:hypothetical protein